MSEEIYSIVVTNCNSGGRGSLSWAIDEANNYTGDGIPEITFDESLAGKVIDVITKDLEVRREMRIVNLEPPVAIVGSYGIRTSADLYMENMRIPRLVVDNSSGDVELSGSNNVFTNVVPVLLICHGSASSVFSGFRNASVQGGGDFRIYLYVEGTASVGTLACADNERYELQNSLNGGWLGVTKGAVLSFYGELDGTLAAGGSTLKGRYELGEGDVLKINDARLEGTSIILHEGSYVEGEGSVLAGDSSFDVRGGNTAEILSGLTSISSESGELKIVVQESFESDCVIAPVQGISTRCVCYHQTIPAGITLRVVDGVTFELAYGPMDVYGTMECPEGYVLSSGWTVCSGGVLKMDGCRVEGDISVASGGQLVGDDVVFASGAYISLSAVNTADALSGLTNVTSEGGALEVRVSCPVGETVTLSAVEGLNIAFSSSSISGVLECQPGVVLGDITVQAGAAINFNGARVEGRIRCESGARLEGDVVFASTGYLDLRGDGWYVNGDISDPTELFANLGKLSSEGEYVRIKMNTGTQLLVAFPGDVKTRYELEDRVLSGEYTVADNVEFYVAGGFRGSLTCGEGSVINCGQGEACLISSELVANGGRFETPLEITSSTRLSGTGMTLAAREALKMSVFWYGAPFSLDKYIPENFELTVEPGGMLSVRISGLSEDIELTPESLSSLAPEAFSGIYFREINVANKQLTVGEGCKLYTGDIIVYANSALVVQPGVQFSNIYDEPCEIELRYGGLMTFAGADLSGTSVVHEGGTLYLDRCTGTGILHLQAADDGSVATIVNCDLSGMQIVLDGTHGANGLVYDLSGNYWGTTDLEEIKSKITGYDEACVNIGEVLSSAPSGEDTSAPELSFRASIESEPSLSENVAMVKLSWSSDEVANYQLSYVGSNGKETVEYSGTDTSCVMYISKGATLDFILTATDMWGNTSTSRIDDFYTGSLAPAPRLELRAPVVSKVNDGVIRVKLSWSGGSGVTYTIMVDGKELLNEDGSVFSTTKTSHTFELKDGEHSYSITARTAEGGVTTSKADDVHASFGMDATAPRASFTGEPVISDREAGKATASFAWEAEAGASYTLKVDGKVVYSGSDNECALVLKEGKHKYELTATDAAGNTSEPFKGNFSFDATAPKLKLGKTSVARVDEGAISATLSWKSEKGATYVVEVDGEVVYSGTETTYATTTLRDGEHSYKVTATDAEGNTSEQEGSFSLDATSPVVNLSTDAPAVSGAKNGKAKVTLTWEGNEEGVRYTVMVDGKKAYSGTKPECTVNLKDGEHRYYITAEDKAGNVGQSAEGSFSFDATAPVVALQTPTISYEAAGAGKGTVTLAATSNEESTSYRVTLTKDGKALEGEYGLALGELADGTYKYTLIAVDAAGNESKKQTGSFLVDSTPPGAPVLKGEVKCSRKGENKSDVKLSWTAPLDPTDPKGKKTEKVASYQISCYDEEGNLLQSVSSKGTSYTFKGLQDGNYHFHVSAVDKAGNGGEALRVENVAVDTVASEITGLAHEVFLGEMEAGKSGAALSWVGGEESAATYIIKLGGKTYTFAYDAEVGEYLASAKVGKETVTLSLWQAEDGSFTYYHPVELKDGKYKYSITATDAAGNKKEYKGEEVMVVDSKTLPDMDDSGGSQMRPGISALSAGLSLDEQLQLSAGVPGMAATGLADACCASGLELLGAEKADKPETSLLA